MVAFLENAKNISLLALGFGFVVFWHELGHFLAAKWAGVKVEQFAVGFGQALFSWRKGVGFRYGSTQKEFHKRIEEHLDADEKKRQTEDLQLKEKIEGAPTDLQVARAAAELNLGETEYRLNWIPLGGYVKMLGQDDLKPNADADDPRAFNRQPIGKRMVIVSAGVVMNVILAAIGFMVLFLWGFNVIPARVGAVLPGSPAQVAGVLSGDVIKTINGREQNDWTSVQLNVALCASNEKTPITVERVVDGQKQIIPLEIEAKKSAQSKDFLTFGILPALSLKGPTAKDLKDAGEANLDDKTLDLMLPAEMHALKAGDAIVAIAGKPVDPNPVDPRNDQSFLVLDQALQRSNGKPVEITVAADKGNGAKRQIMVQPHFQEPFGDDLLNFAGMVPRVEIAQVPKESLTYGKLLPGDVITHVSTNAGGGPAALDDPSIKQFRQRMNDAGKAVSEISVTVLRGNQPIPPFDHLRAKKIDAESYGLGIHVQYDEGHPVVADVVPGSAAHKAQIPAQATILKVAGEPVSNWYDVQTAMKKWADSHKDAVPMPPLVINYKAAGGDAGQASLEFSPEDIAAIDSYTYTQELNLDSQHIVRQTSNPLRAAMWGVTETRDFILQFYLTLNRMRSGDVSPKNMMGPVGIFQAGTGFAAKGTDWLIWFLSMISANLAVVNFLPIPIVDGGLFTFLILEKVKGRPLSPKTQAIAQYVGMALLLGIVLFVTWQDVMNYSYRSMH